MRSFVGLLCLAVAVPAAAQRSPAPNVPKEALTAPALDMLNPDSQALYKTVEKHWIDATKAMITIMGAAQNNQLATVSPDHFSKTYSDLILLRVKSRWLHHFGEPAGIDFERRANAMNAIFQAIARQYRQLPAAQSYMAKVNQEFNANATRRAAEYRAAAELEAKNRFPQAETKVEGVTAKWRLRTGLLPEDQVVGWYSPFLLRFRPPMERSRRETGAESLAKLRNKSVVDVAAQLALAQRAAADIGQSGSTEIDGKMLDGPDAFNQLGRGWKLGHWNLARAEAVEMARSSVLNADTPELNTIRAEHAKLTQSMPAALAKVIAADSSRATPDLHARYATAAASLAINADVRIMKPLDEALTELGKKAQLAGIDSLDVALNDMLRWRRLATDARAATRLKQNPDVSQILSATTSQNPTMGFFIPGTGTPPMFIGCAPEIITLANAAGKKTSVPFVVSGTSTATTRFSRLHQRVFATITPGWDVAVPLAALKADLLVSDQLPPLTLSAAAAVQSAEAGAFLRCGGTCGTAYAKSLLQLRATLPAANWNVLPLGPLERNQTQHVKQGVLQLTIVPEWLQHDYFLLTVPARPTS